AVGAIAAPESATHLLPLLDHDDAQVRFEAARGLGLSVTDDTLPVLVAHLTQPGPMDRHAVLLALGGALERLHLASPDARRLADALGEFGAGRDAGLAARSVDTLGRWSD